MKRLSTTKNLCVCQRDGSLCALPFHKPRLFVFSSLVFTRVLRLRSLFIPLVSSAVLDRTAPAHFHTAPSLH
jgi:hypothetical protein